MSRSPKSEVFETHSKYQHTYDSEFFDSIEDGSQESAKIIVPIVLKLVQPKSVVDIGCGRGVWLREFQRNGVQQIFGVDGTYVRPQELLIDPEFFRGVDLTTRWRLDGRYDLVVCLEVAEHLPQRSAKHLVSTLASAAPLVLFSAAVPNQVGTHHINEQWPAYWQRLFRDLGYRQLDPIRRHIIHDDRVASWYRQNIFLYASDKAIASSSLLQIEEEYRRRMPLEYIDKRVLGHLTSAQSMFRELPRTLLRALKNRIYR
jgi:SAM-dependent methyltransferase